MAKRKRKAKETNEQRIKRLWPPEEQKFLAALGSFPLSMRTRTHYGIKDIRTFQDLEDWLVHIQGRGGRRVFKELAPFLASHGYMRATKLQNAEARSLRSENRRLSEELERKVNTGEVAELRRAVAQLEEANASLKRNLAEHVERAERMYAMNWDEEARLRELVRTLREKIKALGGDGSE